MSDGIQAAIELADPQGQLVDSVRTEGAPACEVCGRQDETLRVVVYPFAFSVVLASFQRAYAGRWCRTHRNRRLTLASLITATVGWLGIPFGFIRTPAVLFGLAQGGIQPPELNTHMLSTLAEHKLQAGDAQGAVRCLEAALQFSENESVEQRLRQVSTEFALPHHRRGRWGLLLIPLTIIIGASLVGATIGVLDAVITALFWALLSGSGSIYALILSWTPFLAMIFIGGLALYQLLESGIARLALRRLGPGFFLSILAALVATASVS